MVTRRTKSIKSRLLDLSMTREGMATSFDGTKIAYKTVGSGLPLICCNGIGCNTFYFKWIEEHFKAHHQVITWDYRGHGKSESPKKSKNSTILSLVKDMKSVMDELKIEKAVLIGHSMGVQIIYEFYKHYPHHARGLIACFGTFEKPMSTFLNSPFSKYVFEGVYHLNQNFPVLMKWIGMALIKNPLWFQVGGLLKFMKTTLLDKNVMQQYIDHFVTMDPIFFTTLVRDWQNHSSVETLKAIKVPTLIISGEEDQFTPAWISKKMHHLIPGSELFMIKNATYAGLAEQPELVNLRIEKFLKQKVK